MIEYASVLEYGSMMTCRCLVSDIAIFVLKRDVKLQLTNLQMFCTCLLNVKWWSIVTPKILTVSVSGTTQPATFTLVSGDNDDLVCYDVDRSTASDFSGLITRPF